MHPGGLYNFFTCPKHPRRGFYGPSQEKNMREFGVGELLGVFSGIRESTKLGEFPNLLEIL